MKRKKKLAGAPILLLGAGGGLLVLVWWRRRARGEAPAGDPLHWLPTGQPQAIFLDLPVAEPEPIIAGDTIYNTYNFQTHGGGTPGGVVGGEPDTHGDSPGDYPAPTSPPIVTRPGPKFYDPGGDVWDLPSRLPENPIPGEPPVAE